MSSVEIDTPLVQRLIAEQFPHWSGLEIFPVVNGGWDNRTFHLGGGMLVRLPSAEGYSLQAEKEQYWLPKLAPLLPLPIPASIASGKPTAEYLWHWSVYKWIEGETASTGNIAELGSFALCLAGFLRALQQIDASEGPAAGTHNWHRGGLLSTYNEETQWAIKRLGREIDVTRANKIWDAALSSSWEYDPVWVHGDVAPGNLLVRQGSLCAVIDFGCLGVGDPACDLVMAWTFFHGKSRKVFRSTLCLDDSTWGRALGWVLWKALIVSAELPGIHVNRLEIEKSKKIIDEVLNEDSLVF